MFDSVMSNAISAPGKSKGTATAPARRQPKKAQINSKPLGSEINTFSPERPRSYRFLAIVSTLGDQEFIWAISAGSGRRTPVRRIRSTRARVKLRRPVQLRSDPRRRFVATNAEQPVLRLNPGRRAPTGDEGARQSRVEEIDRNGIIEHAAHARRRYRPTVGAAIPVEPFRDFRIALTKPARRQADPYPHGKAALGHRDNHARVAWHSHCSYCIPILFFDQGSH